MSGLRSYADLVAENEKLKNALSDAIPWIGEYRNGPSWASSEAKVRNAQMCDDAMDQAVQALDQQTMIGIDNA